MREIPQHSQNTHMIEFILLKVKINFAQKYCLLKNSSQLDIDFHTVLAYNSQDIYY